MDGILAPPSSPHPVVLKPLGVECRGLVSTLASKPQPGISDPLGLEWSLRMYVCNKFLDDASAAGLGTSLREPLL